MPGHSRLAYSIRIATWRARAASTKERERERERWYESTASHPTSFSALCQRTPDCPQVHGLPQQVVRLPEAVDIEMRQGRMLADTVSVRTREFPRSSFIFKTKRALSGESELTGVSKNMHARALPL